MTFKEGRCFRMAYFEQWTNTPTYLTAKVNLQVTFNLELDLMFMKHYAPNRCLYIKVAKLRTGVGSAETSYLRDVIPTKLQCQAIQRALQIPNLQREII